MASDKMNIQFRIKAVDNFSKNMNKLSQQLDKVQRKAEQLGTIENIKVGVTGDKTALKQLDRVEDKAEEVGRKAVWVSIKTNALDAWNDYRSTMGKIASFSRNIGELVQGQLMSAFITLAPTAVSGLASIGAAIGALGPIIGTTAGGVLGLGSAFASAGAGAVAFGALATSVLGDVFEANDDIKKLREELSQTDDLEERAEIQQEIADAVNNLSKEQQMALSSVQSLSSAWSDLTASVQPQIVQAFANTLGTVESILTRLTPMFESVADAGVRLSEALKLNVESDDFNTFIDFLNSTAAPMFETMTKAAGNFVMGINNMLVAFGPLAEEMAGGFLDMSKRFREWAAGLSESEKFNAFVDYVRDNGPKLLSIFDGLTDGLVDFFAAFGPFASEMLDGLDGMIDKFEEWASTLSENPAFQEFIDYVLQEGPNFLSVLGELRDFLINIGKGFARVAEVMNPLLELIYGFFNVILEGNPWIAKLIAWVVTLAGVIGGLIPTILLSKSVFGLLAPVFSYIGAAIMRFLPWIARIGASLLGLSNPIGWVVSAVIFLAGIFISHWDEIWAWTKKTFNKVKNFLVVLWDATKTYVTEKVKQLVSGSIRKFLDFYNGAKDLFNRIKTFISNVWNAIKRSVVNYVKNMIRSSIQRFVDFVNSVKDKFNNVKDTITSAWDSVMDFLGGINLYSIGRNIIQGMVNGIESMGRTLVRKAKGVVNGAINAAKSLLGIASPSKVFAQIGEWTGEGFIGGMDKMVKGVSKSAEVMVGASVPETNPYNDVGYTSNPHNSTYQRDSDVNSDERMLETMMEMRDELRRQRNLVIEMERREVGRLVEPDVSEIQERKKKIKEEFSR